MGVHYSEHSRQKKEEARLVRLAEIRYQIKRIEAENSDHYLIADVLRLMLDEIETLGEKE